MVSERCRAVHLASGDYCEVTRCMDCGSLHLTVGSLSMRLPPHVVKDLAECIAVALNALRTPEETSTPDFQSYKN
ncbi:MAG TPA: hypothetical protein VMH34_00510 [Gammaproteobacteria bacterium]|nr:hypothetical protein [Gammaproteobacteria bacterium]